jgi:hypothetical protein
LHWYVSIRQKQFTALDLMPVYKAVGKSHFLASRQRMVMRDTWTNAAKMTAIPIPMLVRGQYIPEQDSRPIKKHSAGPCSDAIGGWPSASGQPTAHINHARTCNPQ